MSQMFRKLLVATMFLLAGFKLAAKDMAISRIFTELPSHGTISINGYFLYESGILELKPKGGEYQLLANIPIKITNGTLVRKFDTTKYADGEYVLRLTTTAPQKGISKEFPFTIDNTPPKLVSPFLVKSGDGREGIISTGQELNITATFDEKVQVQDYKFLRNGNPLIDFEVSLISDFDLNSVNDLKVADYNKDGRLDVLVAVEYRGAILFLQKDQLQWEKLELARNLDFRVHVLDYNNDGKLDIFGHNISHKHAAYIVQGKKNQWETIPVIHPNLSTIDPYQIHVFHQRIPDTLESIHPGDFNGDGRQDILAKYKYTKDYLISWELTNELKRKQNFYFGNHNKSGDNHPFDIQKIDIFHIGHGDKDGTDEVMAVITQKPKKVKSSNDFPPPLDPFPPGPVVQIVLPDRFVCQVYQSNGKWTRKQIFKDQNHSDFYSFDVNQDGRKDILQIRNWWNWSSMEKNSIWIQLENGEWKESQIDLTFDGYGNLSFSDINQDGKEDIFVGLAMWIQKENLQWSRMPVFSELKAFSVLNSGDFNNDGKMDLIVRARNKIYLLTNVASKLGKFFMIETKGNEIEGTLNFDEPGKYQLLVKVKDIKQKSVVSDWIKSNTFEVSE